MRARSLAAARARAITVIVCLGLGVVGSVPARAGLRTPKTPSRLSSASSPRSGDNLVATDLSVMAATAVTPSSSSPSSSVPVSGNLLGGDRAGFDQSTGGWTPRAAGLSTVSTPTQIGSGALALTASVTGPSMGATSGSDLSSYVPAQAGAVYAAGASVRAASTSRTFRMLLNFYDATGKPIVSTLSQGVGDASDGWTVAPNAIGMAPPAAAYASVGVLIAPAVAGERHFVDAASLYLMPGGQPRLSGPLRTDGNRIVDVVGRRVTLRGIERDTASHTAGGAVREDEIDHMRSWGANVVRLPLDYMWMSDSCNYDPTYPARLDQMVDWVTSRGMLAMLSLGGTRDGTCGTSDVHPRMADAGAPRFWSQVATRYGANPLVAFDLFNEPHHITDEIWLSGGMVTEGASTYQAAGMQPMYDAVRATGASNLVFVSGQNWAARPASYMITGANVVYGAHAYTCPQHTPPCQSPTPLDPTPILDRFATLADQAPVMISETGWPDRSDGRYLANVVAAAEERGLGWIAFAWDGHTSGLFDLLADAGPYYEPAPGGMPVLLGLRRP